MAGVEDRESDNQACKKGKKKRKGKTRDERRGMNGYQEDVLSVGLNSCVGQILAYEIDKVMDATSS